MGYLVTESSGTETVDGIDVNTLSVLELRAKVREKGMRETEVGSAKRETLLTALRSGIWPESVPARAATPTAPPESGNGHAGAQAIADAVYAAMKSVSAPLDEAKVREIAKAEGDVTLGNVQNLLSAFKAPGIDEIRQEVDGKLKAMRDTLAAFPVASINEEKVREIARSEFVPSVVRVQVAELPEVQLPRQHYKFPLLLACAANGIPAYLVGERGSGKTTVGHAVAKALGMEFGSMSLGPATSKSDLIGFIDAKGVYACPHLVRLAREGGVFLLDELDLCHPGSLAQANAILANGQFGSPGGMVTKSELFYCIAGGNTYGHGATTSYKGRQGLDMATLDRFAVITWDYDPQLERIASGLPPNKASELTFDLSAGGKVDPEKWVTLVQKVRSDAISRKLITFPSPRASEFGAKLARAGVGYTHLREMFLVRGSDNMEAICPTSL